LFATKHTFTKQQMGDLLVRWEAPGYTARPTDVLAHVFEAPPCTCTFETDVVNIGGDFGYTYPAPYTEGQDSKWHLVMPKEVDNSGADGFIGQGCGTSGAPESSRRSGRRAVSLPGLVMRSSVITTSPGISGVYAYQ